jgi:hypothetical protein
MRSKKPKINGKGSQIGLSDVLEGYKEVLKKLGIDTSNEDYYYNLVIKLYLNEKKTWRESLKLERDVRI